MKHSCLKVGSIVTVRLLNNVLQKILKNRYNCLIIYNKKGQIVRIYVLEKYLQKYNHIQTTGTASFHHGGHIFNQVTHFTTKSTYNYLEF